MTHLPTQLEKLLRDAEKFSWYQLPNGMDEVFGRIRELDDTTFAGMQVRIRELILSAYHEGLLRARELVPEAETRAEPDGTYDRMYGFNEARSLILSSLAQEITTTK